MPGPDLATLAKLPQGPDIASAQDHLVQAVKAACPSQLHTRTAASCLLYSDQTRNRISSTRVHLSFSMRIRKNDVPTGASPYTVNSKSIRRHCFEPASLHSQRACKPNIFTMMSSNSRHKLAILQKTVQHQLHSILWMLLVAATQLESRLEAQVQPPSSSDPPSRRGPEFTFAWRR